MNSWPHCHCHIPLIHLWHMPLCECHRRIWGASGPWPQDAQNLYEILHRTKLKVRSFFDSKILKNASVAEALPHTCWGAYNAPPYPLATVGRRFMAERGGKKGKGYPQVGSPDVLMVNVFWLVNWLRQISPGSIRQGLCYINLKPLLCSSCFFQQV